MGVGMVDGGNKRDSFGRKAITTDVSQNDGLNAASTREKEGGREGSTHLAQQFISLFYSALTHFPVSHQFRLPSSFHRQDSPRLAQERYLGEDVLVHLRLESHVDGAASSRAHPPGLQVRHLEKVAHVIWQIKHLLRYTGNMLMSLGEKQAEFSTSFITDTYFEGIEGQ
jgi:hypothetical protein